MAVAACDHEDDERAVEEGDGEAEAGRFESHPYRNEAAADGEPNEDRSRQNRTQVEADHDEAVEEEQSERSHSEKTCADHAENQLLLQVR